MEKIKWILSIILGAIASFSNKYGLLFALVTVAIAIDCVTGLIKSKVTGVGLSSKKGTQGFFKKLSLIVALFFGIFVDWFLPTALLLTLNIEIPFKAPFALIIACYIVLNESISIAENLFECNPNSIPKWIKNALTVAKNKIDKSEDKADELRK